MVTKVSFQSQASPKAPNLETFTIVNWGGKQYKLEIIKVTPDGKETIVGLSEQSIKTLSQNLEAILPNLQSGPLNPNLHQFELCLKPQIDQGMQTGYVVSGLRLQKTSACPAQSIAFSPQNLPPLLPLLGFALEKPD